MWSAHRRALFVIFLATLALMLVGVLFIVREGSGIIYSAWSNEGEWIAFDCYGFHTNGSLYLVRPDGSDLHQITNEKLDATVPNWSEDGSAIIFGLNGDDRVKSHLTFGYEAGIYKLERNHAELSQLSTESYDAFPSLSPNGQWVAYWGGKVPGERTLFQMATDGTGYVRLLSGIKQEGGFDWSPDGQWLAFDAADGKLGPGMFKISIDGGNVRPFIEQADFPDEVVLFLNRLGSNPGWSPTGTSISFSVGGEIFVADMNEGKIRQVTEVRGAAYDLAWSPDGDWLIFAALAQSGYVQLFKIQADGSDLQQLTDIDCWAFSPDWVQMPQGIH